MLRFGHEKSASPSDATILVMELPDVDSEKEKVFAANATSKCSLRIGEEVGDGMLDKQVAKYIAESGASCHLMPDADGLINSQKCTRRLSLADTRKVSIVGYGDYRSFPFQRQLGTRQIAPCSACPTVKLQPRLTHFLGTRRPPTYRRGERGNSQSGMNGEIPLNREALPPIWVPP